MAHTMAFVAPVMKHWLEREIAQWVHTMKDWSDDPSHHERTLLPRRSHGSLAGIDLTLMARRAARHLNHLTMACPGVPIGANS